MRSQSSKPLIAWDLDNTLFDRDAAFLRCLRELFESHSARAENLTSESLRRIVEFDRSGQANRLATMSVVAREFGLHVSNAEALWAAVQEALPRHVEADPAALRLFEELSPSHRLALVSNGGVSLQRRKLAKTGLAQFFAPSFIIISGEVGCAKPDPAIFQELERRSGSPLDTMLFVGDDPVNDIAGASAAKMQTCWVSRGRSLPDGISPTFVVRDLGEMQSLIRKEILT